MKKEEELEKEGLEPATLQQEEEGKGVSKSGRQLVMEKLMVAAAGKMESRVILLTNMVGPEDVDEDLQEDVEQECNKYGKVDHIVIYHENYNGRFERMKRVLELCEEHGITCRARN